MPRRNAQPKRQQKSNTSEDVFRADNLKIATQIAFNNWLWRFDRLYRSCSLQSLEDGEFVVTINNHNRDGSIQNGHSETHTAEYYGPADMFTAEHLHEHGGDEYRRLYKQLEGMLTAGDPRVRRSNRSGLIMFTCSFPRYRADGDWWSSENTFLSTDPGLAYEQIEYALATDEERADIARSNCEAAQQLSNRRRAGMSDDVVTAEDEADLNDILSIIGG
jgi:hypothetical protein